MATDKELHGRQTIDAMGNDVTLYPGDPGYDNLPETEAQAQHAVESTAKANQRAAAKDDDKK